MAVEPDFVKKRKRKKNDRKLLVGEKVEVRSEEDGFLGSWHSGTVIEVGKLRRHVKYDHLLTDDAHDNLVDVVYVSSILDGSYCVNASQCHNRGHIRPLPAPLEFEKWNLPYGYCVDAYYKEAWWEGVIFDHNDGSEERRVFFPDLGDEMTVGIDSLRITQDWDEFMDTWHSRGTWLFLELIEEYEKESYVAVSVKQIWYDLREKKGFKKIKGWTSAVRSLWEELVVEVIHDNLKIFEDYVYRVLRLPESSEQETQPPLEFATPVSDVTVYPEVELGKSHAIVPVDNPWNSNEMNMNYTSTQPVQEKSDQFQLITVSEDVGPNMHHLNGSGGSCFDKSLCVVPQALVVLPSKPGGNLGISEIKHSHGEGFSSIKSNKINREFKSSKCRKTVNWLPADLDIGLGAEFCPNAITKYAQIIKRKERNLLLMDVKKHLKYLNWKIAYTRDDKGTLRLRYSSPKGKHYYSLHQVCLDLTKTTMKILSPASQHGQKNLHITPDNSQSPPPEQPEGYWDLDCCPQTLDSYSSEMLIVEPEHNPQAVVDWYMFGVDEKDKGNLKRKDMISKARRHLTALGWEFKYVKTVKRILYYYSPNGKCYNSLRSACKACLEASVSSETSASTGGATENVIIGEEVENQLGGRKLSYAVSNPEFQKRVVQSNALSKNLTAGSMSQSRKLKRKRKINSSHLLEIQADSYSSSVPKFKRGKASRALISLEEDLEYGRRISILRSSKRVKQWETPSSSNHNPRTLLSWLIDNNVVLPRAKVIYRTRKKRSPKAEGRITREGIKCNCCGRVYSLSKFELHAGSTVHSPANHIFLEDGRSLLECQLHVLNDGNQRNFTGEPQGKLKRNHHQVENDYICSVCHYGGELILCDRCPSSFHKNCLGLEDIPDGDWFCPSCCCGICGSSKFREDAENIIDEDILICYQCERKYHRGCLQNGVAAKLGTRSKENCFCSKKCEEIFLGLRKLLGKPIPIRNNLTWTLVKSMQLDSPKLDASDIEALSKLNIALGVMHECFEPVYEPHIGGDLVEDVIFSRGSELKRLNFPGFYTILLEKNEELITVATVRVYGEKAAEIPLVGTRFKYRRLGMCRILMNELEKKLIDLGVQRLILPAIPSVLKTWTTSFGFSRMTNSERLQFVDYTFLDFQDTIMCQKILLKSPSEELNLPRGSFGVSVALSEENFNIYHHTTLETFLTQQFTGAQPKIKDDFCKSGENIDLAGSSTISEVFQAEQIEDSGIVEQRLVESKDSC